MPLYANLLKSIWGLPMIKEMFGKSNIQYKLALMLSDCKKGCPVSSNKEKCIIKARLISGADHIRTWDLDPESGRASHEETEATEDKDADFCINVEPKYAP